ncbi:MAG: tetratricopeptide repeat protein [Candidatus Caenarcaniphilales bacterium]|nr:tetratricopeptide repeat protein [Candidatus Caenarcaniphilales bacterium]
MKWSNFAKTTCLITLTISLVAIGFGQPLYAYDENIFDIEPSATKSPLDEIEPQARELYKLSYEVAQRKDYQAAITYLEQALKISPHYQDALFNLGSVYLAQRKYPEAYFFFQRLLYINPNDHEARLQKVNALVGMQNAPEAMIELAKIPTQTRGFDQVHVLVTRLVGQITQHTDDALTEEAKNTNLPKPKPDSESEKISIEQGSEKQEAPEQKQMGRLERIASRRQSNDDEPQEKPEPTPELSIVKKEKVGEVEDGFPEAAPAPINRKKPITSDRPTSIEEAKESLQQAALKDKNTPKTSPQLVPSPSMPQKGFYGYVTPNPKPSLPSVIVHNFNAPAGIASDNQSIYIANFLENKIEKITPDGKRREIFADGGLLAGPSGMVYNPQDGRLYVTNYRNGTIVAIEQTGETKLIARDLLKPYALILHNNGKLYVSEQGKKAISVVEIKR